MSERDNKMIRKLTRWFTYRATVEHLKQEKVLLLSGARTYKGQAEPERLIVLAERIEARIPTVHSHWFNKTNGPVAIQKMEGA